jgi:hypothetical protein
MARLDGVYIISFMPRPCTVCSRIKERLAIDTKLMTGASATSVAAEYGLRIDAVLRHKQNHLHKNSEGSSSITMLKQVIGELDDAALQALAKDDVRAVIDSRKRKADLVQTLMQHETANEAKATVNNSSLDESLKKIPVELLDRIVASVTNGYTRCPYCGEHTLKKATGQMS